MDEETMVGKQEHQNEGRMGVRGWRTFLMLAGSALLGGTAVALWHRRLLGEIRRDTRPNLEPNRDEIMDRDDEI
jgi:hypothetical protein